MELLNRHRNLTVLVLVLFAQIIGLAVQVKRPAERGSVRLIRVWGINLITPAEDGVVHAQDWIRDIWRNYFYLRDVRRENDRLRDENTRLRLEQVRMVQDASQAQRLQALLKFKEQFISQTVAAQVIGSSGSEQSHVIYIDKGADDGLKTDMAVITPGGIVGKVLRVFADTAQVLEINDQSSGVGAILEKSRLQGILKGTPAGGSALYYIMGDEKVEPGETVLTSGGDSIFPKGLPVGRVVQVSPGPDAFLNIRVKPSARLDRVEEVLVITRIVEKERDLVPETPLRAADILAQRLPTVQPQPPAPSVPGSTATAGAPAGATSIAAAHAGNTTKKAEPETKPNPKPASPGTAAASAAHKAAAGAGIPKPSRPVSRTALPGANQTSAHENQKRKPAEPASSRDTAVHSSQNPAPPPKDSSE